MPVIDYDEAEKRWIQEKIATRIIEDVEIRRLPRKERAFRKIKSFLWFIAGPIDRWLEKRRLRKAWKKNDSLEVPTYRKFWEKLGAIEFDEESRFRNRGVGAPVPPLVED